ncbi:hypothetical protein [Alienimonas californiensis]|uniref:Uncharacterized protein n=1 Tax=Alienimonas californiensis TaxID=2527989 RepID=A0A517P783_9PLAN|nr:hypothetical protein [Alienimonas californiensis]QDT15238.1 hypothetical protein CA12_13210 [Alienimonas californiensis]
MPAQSRCVLFLAGALLALTAGAVPAGAQVPSEGESAREPASVPAEKSGYLLVPNGPVSQEFDAGFSLYAAAWPLLETYPGQQFQSGLFGTWMHPLHDPQPEERLYNTIEGGLGWWRDTRFATATPKFIMGGVALNFSAWANGPGAGKGRDWAKPNGKEAVVQLSPRVLWPPDGLNLKQGTCGELFGYGYLPLPLIDPQPTTDGAPVPTGGQCWTLFLNAGNFKGPVAFFAPSFWSRPTIERPELAGLFLDAKPSKANRALQMETQFIPAVVATAEDGTRYARVARTLFPANRDGASVTVHKISSYRRAALWDAVEAWFAGGPPADGRIDAGQAVVHPFPGRGGATWRIFERGTPREDRIRLDWDAIATPTAFAEDAYGFRWNEDLTTSATVDGNPAVALPEYYRLGEDARGNPLWQPIKRGDVPASVRFDESALTTPGADRHDAYVTPLVAENPDGRDATGAGTDAATVWTTPGPAVGPFTARPGDGSEVTYHWYRFADQPAVLQAGLSDAEREVLQKRVELLHRHWTPDRDYLPPPTDGALSAGALAEIDPALLVTPPAGLEIGYVPIVTRQAAGPDR